MENNIIEAEFKVVQERTLDIIATEIRTIDNHVCQVALNGAIEIGKRLEEAKEKVGHGNWENWCKENLNYSASWAAKLMKISSEYGTENSPYLAAISKTDTCADFSISKAFRLLQMPENEVEDFAKNNDISEMKVKELEAEIKKYKSQNEGYERQQEELEESLLRAREEKESIEREKEATYQLLQELQENQLAAENGKLSEEAKTEILERQKEIDKLQSDLDEWKEKEKKYETEKALFEEEKLKAIQEAEAKAKEEAQAEAEKAAADTIEKLAKEAEEAIARAETAEKKLSMVSNEDITLFKLKTNELQMMVSDIKNAIDNISTNDDEQAAKMRDAFKKLMQALYDKI